MRQAVQLVPREGRNESKEERYDEKSVNYIIERAVARQKVAEDVVETEVREFNVKLEEARCLTRGQVYESLLGIADKKHIDAAIEDLEKSKEKRRASLEVKVVDDRNAPSNIKLEVNVVDGGADVLRSRVRKHQNINDSEEDKLYDDFEWKQSKYYERHPDNLSADNFIKTIIISSVSIVPALYGFSKGYAGQNLDATDYMMPVMFGTAGGLLRRFTLGTRKIEGDTKNPEMPFMLVGGTVGNLIMCLGHCVGSLIR